MFLKLALGLLGLLVLGGETNPQYPDQPNEDIFIAASAIRILHVFEVKYIHTFDNWTCKQALCRMETELIYRVSYRIFSLILN